MRNKADGPADCLVMKMLHQRLKGECRAPEAWKILRLVFLKKPDDKLRGFRALNGKQWFWWIYHTRRGDD